MPNDYNTFQNPIFFFKLNLIKFRRFFFIQKNKNKIKF